MKTETMNTLGITTGKQSRPQRVVIYGIEGIGKSTLAMTAPKPLFLDTENGSGHLDVARIAIAKYDDITEAIKGILKLAKAGECDYKSVVIDTADNLWRMCADYAIAKNNEKQGATKWETIEDAGYGKGYVLANHYFSILLAGFDALIKNGVNVIIISHAQVTTVSPPDTAEYTKYCIKVSVSNKSAQASREKIKEWCDALLFYNFETQVNKATSKAIGEQKRIIHTAPSGAWEAKNRHGLEAKSAEPEAVLKAIFDSVESEGK